MHLIALTWPPCNTDLFILRLSPTIYTRTILKYKNGLANNSVSKNKLRSLIFHEISHTVLFHHLTHHWSRAHVCAEKCISTANKVRNRQKWCVSRRFHAMPTILHIKIHSPLNISLCNFFSERLWCVVVFLSFLFCVQNVFNTQYTHKLRTQSRKIFCVVAGLSPRVYVEKCMRFYEQPTAVSIQMILRLVVLGSLSITLALFCFRRLIFLAFLDEMSNYDFSVFARHRFSGYTCTRVWWLCCCLLDVAIVARSLTMFIL